MRHLISVLLLASLAAAAPETSGKNPYAALPILNGRRAETGELVGEAAFGAKRVAALLHQVDGAWVLALKTGAKKLSDMFPRLKGTVVDDLDVKAPVLIFSNARVNVRTLSPAARAFYGDTSLDLERGINLVTSASPNGAIKKTFALAGLAVPRVRLTGIVLRDFDADELKEARDNGKLKEALRKGTMIKAALPKFSLKLPKSFQTGDAYLYVTGEPGVGVGFTMTMRQPDGRRFFECRLGVRKTDIGATEASIFAMTKGRWANAFGIKGLNLDEARVVFTIDAAQRIGVGLKAKMAVGRRTMMVGGKVLLHAVTGAPMGGAFEGRLSRLTSDDLVMLMNAKSKKGRVGDGGLPAFELRNAYLRIAPGGGDPNLEIKSGFGIAGSLVAFGRVIASVDGEMTDAPMTRLKGHIRDFDLGAVSLRRGMVDVKMGAVRDPHFRMRGDAKLAILQKSIDIDANRKRYFFQTREKVAGVYEADWSYYSRSGPRPAWAVTARFHNHFTRTLEQDFSRAATNWANQVKRDNAKAQRDLTIAQQRVRQLDGKIAAARRKVHAERQAAWKRLDAAKRRVAWYDNEIAQREARLAKLRQAIPYLKKQKDKAYKRWQAAIRATKKAKVWDKPKYKAIEAKRLSEYTYDKGRYDAARSNLSKLARVLDPELNKLRAGRATEHTAYLAASKSYKWITRAPVDADPRVAGLITARGTAMGSLIAAKKIVGATAGALRAAGRVTAYAAKNNGQILMVDSASMAGRLDSYLRNNRMEIKMSVRVMGKRKNLRLYASARDIRAGKLFKDVFRTLRSAL